MVVMTRPKPEADLLQKLVRFRPRFLYVWVRVEALPVPILLFAPLSLLHLLPLAGRWVMRNKPNLDPEARYALQALGAFGGQISELRRMPGFALVEVSVGGKLLAESKMGSRGVEGVYVKIGLW